MDLLKLILLVDDDETTNYLNKRLLTRMEIAERIEVVTNGEEALHFLMNAAENGNPMPDLMFLDIKMPVMDGFEFLEEYQRLPEELKRSIVVMMLTSSASVQDMERIKQYDTVRRHISKPLLAAHVNEIIKEYFSAKSE